MFIVSSIQCNMLWVLINVEKCFSCGCSQEKSHMLVTRVICGSFSATTWTDTRGCTVERSRTSVIAAIRLASHCFSILCMLYFSVHCLFSVVSIAPLTFFPAHLSMSGCRTSQERTGYWDTDGYVQSGWARRKTSSHRTHLPIQLPGAPYSLPTTAWLSDPQLHTETLQAAAVCSSVTSHVGVQQSCNPENSLAQTQPNFSLL